MKNKNRIKSNNKNKNSDISNVVQYVANLKNISTMIASCH
jgi:hypothetical protein